MLTPIVETWTRVEPALERLNRGNFRLLTRMQLLQVLPGMSVLRPLQGTRAEEVPADLVVLVLPREPLGPMHEELRAAVPHFALVGDALAPRDLQAAIREGHLAARAIR